VEAIRVAKEHGIDVLIDAVTNVRFSYVAFAGEGLTKLQHKLGADGKEEVRAVEVHPQNRNRVVGPEKVIEVSFPILGQSSCRRYHQAWTKYDFNERGGKVISFIVRCVLH
jgi:hypothetical protein